MVRTSLPIKGRLRISCSFSHNPAPQPGRTDSCIEGCWEAELVHCQRGGAQRIHHQRSQAHPWNGLQGPYPSGHSEESRNLPRGNPRCIHWHQHQQSCLDQRKKECPMLDPCASRWCTDKESACQCRRCNRGGFYPWVGKIPWRRAWQPTPVFFAGKSHGQRSLAGYSPRGHKELDRIEQLNTHTHIHTSICVWSSRKRNDDEPNKI